MLRTVEYQDVFADLADIYLEDSWVLDVSATEHGVAFRLDAVLTPDHLRYHPPAPGEQHCYLQATRPWPAPSDHCCIVRRSRRHRRVGDRTSGASTCSVRWTGTATARAR